MTPQPIKWSEVDSNGDCWDNSYQDKEEEEKDTLDPYLDDDE